MKDSICKLNTSIRSVLTYINAAPAGIAFIVDNKDVLCGVLTDGDIRRALIAGRDLDDNLTSSDLAPFVKAKRGENIESLLSKTSKKVRIIPIVDEDDKLVDYFRYEHKTKFTPISEPSLNGNEYKYLEDAFLSTWISSKGKYINQFEEEFAKYIGTKHGIAVSNGTVAIHIILEALGIGAGDEVIVPDLTFAATINTVLHAGATPVIVDIEEDSWCIDPSKIEAAITPKTKAIIPVHIYGQPCDMDPIMAIADKHNLTVIEDAAEAHGATYKGKKVGSIGHAATFSFFSNKIVTTGEGGMCMVHDDELNEKIRILRDHGMNPNKKYWHDVVGYNYRMTNLQAAIGCAQIERIDEIIRRRKEIESEYKKIFADTDYKIEWQADLENRERVNWLVSAKLIDMERQEFIDFFKTKSVDIRPFFFPLSAMPLYAKYAHTECEVSHRIAKIGISFPTFNHVDLEVFKQL